MLNSNFGMEPGMNLGMDELNPGMDEFNSLDSVGQPYDGLDPVAYDFAKQTAMNYRDRIGTEFVFNKAKEGVDPSEAIAEVDNEINGLLQEEKANPTNQNDIAQGDSYRTQGDSYRTQGDPFPGMIPVKQDVLPFQSTGPITPLPEEELRTPAQILADFDRNYETLLGQAPKPPKYESPFENQQVAQDYDKFVSTMLKVPMKQRLEMPKTDGLDLLATGIAGLFAGPRQQGELSQIPLVLSKKRNEIDNLNKEIDFENAKAIYDAGVDAAKLRVDFAIKKADDNYKTKAAIYQTEVRDFENKLQSLKDRGMLGINAWQKWQADEVARLKIQAQKIEDDRKEEAKILKEFYAMPYDQQSKLKDEYAKRLQSLGSDQVLEPTYTKADIDRRNTAYTKLNTIINTWMNLDEAAQKKQQGYFNNLLRGLEKEAGVGANSFGVLEPAKKATTQIAEDRRKDQKEQFEKRYDLELMKFFDRLAARDERAAEREAKESKKIDYKDPETGKYLNSYYEDEDRANKTYRESHAKAVQMKEAFNAKYVTGPFKDVDRNNPQRMKEAAAVTAAVNKANADLQIYKDLAAKTDRAEERIKRNNEGKSNTIGSERASKKNPAPSKGVGLFSAVAGGLIKGGPKGVPKGGLPPVNNTSPSQPTTKKKFSKG